MSLPIDRTTKSALDANLVNGNTSDAPVIKTSNDVVYNTIDELNAKVDALVGSSALSPYPPAQYNKLINGNFDIWQRGSSASIVNQYSADRWVCLIGATSAIGTVTKQPFAVGQTQVPNNPKNFTRINPTTLTGCTSFTFEQRIEDVSLFSGQKITISFWAKSDTPQNINVSARQGFGSGGSSDIPSTSTTFPLTTFWQKLTVTITIPSISGKIIGTNGDYLAISLGMPLTGTYSIDIAQVQVNSGNTVLPFQPRSYNQENLDSLRYRWQSWADTTTSPGIGSISGYASSTSTLIVNVRYPVPLRISPTISVQNNNVPNQVRNTSTGAIVPATYSSAGGQSNKGLAFISFTGTPFTVGQYYDFDIIADAEI